MVGCAFIDEGISVEHTHTLLKIHILGYDDFAIATLNGLTGSYSLAIAGMYPRRVSDCYDPLPHS